MSKEYTEHDFQDKYVDLFRETGAYIKPITGSVFMSGQPDLEIVSRYGAIIKVELKLHRLVSLPTRDSMIKLLKGPQVNVITRQLWGRNAPCLLIAEIAAVKDKLCIVTKDKLMFDTIHNSVKLIAHAPFGTCPYL